MSEGNGLMSSIFSKTATAAKPAKAKQVEVTADVETSDLSPESVCTSPKFILVDGVCVGAVKITPEIASVWLQSNENNFRPLREALVNKYAEAMKKGQWEHNGESITFDAKGQLANGQHRLHACVKSGVPFTSAVHYGIKSSENIDTGSTRGLNQLLAFEGFRESNLLSATINYLHAFADEGSVGFVTVGHGRHVLTRHDAVQFAKDNGADLSHSISVTRKCKTLFSKYGLHVALHFLFAKTAGQALADQFYTSLIDGTGLSSNSAIYVLREKLLRERSKKDLKMQINPYAGLIIKGWNYWVGGQEVQRFTYNYETEKIAKIKRSPLSR